MEEEQNSFSYGFPKGFYAKTLIYGVPLIKGGIIVGVIVGLFQMREKFFPDDWILQYLLFFVLTLILTIWLMLPSRAGGSNLAAVLYFHKKRKHKYWSIERNAYPEYQTPNMSKKRIWGKGRGV